MKIDYLKDGADSTSKAILHLIDTFPDIEESWDHNLQDYSAFLEVVRWEDRRINSPEYNGSGYELKLVYLANVMSEHFLSKMSVRFHSSCGNIYINVAVLCPPKKFEIYIPAPGIDFLSALTVSKIFRDEEVHEAAKYIDNLFKQFWNLK